MIFIKVTIRDVARVSGFSITAVSLVLNNKECTISESTKAIIRKTAQDLGYRPNKLAVGLLKKKTGVLGLIIPDNSNMFFSELSKSVEISARNRGYSIIYGNTNDVYHRDYEYLKLFVDHQVDGIVITKSSSLSEEEDVKNLNFLNKQGIPYVVVDRQPESFISNLVTVDNRLGGYIATKYLLDNGHRKIGTYTGPLQLSTGKRRLDGYKKALSEYDIEFDERLVFEGNFSLGTEKAALKRFLKHNVTAIFCQNDIMAFGIYREAIKNNIHIPDDLSIVGYDNILLTDIVYPGLTTINQPIKGIGEESVRILIEAINNKDHQPETKELYPSLVIRESVKELKEK